ncbi:MAG: tetratricopeptide repeat protein [bacterium]
MSRRTWWFLYAMAMGVLIIAIIYVLSQRKSPEERALEDYYHGIKLYDLKHYDEAIAKFKLAIMYDPHLVSAYYNLALALEERSYKEAADAWEKYLKVVEKENAEKEAWDDVEVAKEHLAYCYYNLGMSAESSEEAIHYLEEYVSMAENMPSQERYVEVAKNYLKELK